MFRWPRMSNRHKAALAVTLAVLLWVPQGISETNQALVTGHTTFMNGEGYDPCRAAVAGILRTQVMWFNDMVLAERYGGRGTYVYLTENGARDPTQERVLFSDGVTYDFTDPNGASWHVEELYMDPTVRPHPNTGVGMNGPDGGVYVDKTYVWVVELSERPIPDRYAGAPDSGNYHTVYNFLLLVDTCKFHNNTATWDGMDVHTNPWLGKEYGHPANATAHAHESWKADLYVGKKPLVAPGEKTITNVTWMSEWTAQGDP